MGAGGAPMIHAVRREAPGGVRGWIGLLLLIDTATGLGMKVPLGYNQPTTRRQPAGWTMGIWSYQEASPNLVYGSQLAGCVYCHTALEQLKCSGPERDRGKSVEFCPVCGWWAVTLVDMG